MKKLIFFRIRDVKVGIFRIRDGQVYPWKNRKPSNQLEDYIKDRRPY